MFLFETTTTAIDVADFIKVAGGALIAGFFAWLFNRKKTNSDVEKNEAEIIQTYVKIIADLQTDIDKFIVKVKGLRGEVEAIEDAKRRADTLILEVKKIDQESIEALHAAFKAEKAKLMETVVSLQMVVNNLSKAIDNEPAFRSLRMEAIRITELLHYLKTRLQP